jgi:hypothetical protein
MLIIGRYGRLILRSAIGFLQQSNGGDGLDVTLIAAMSQFPGDGRIMLKPGELQPPPKYNAEVCGQKVQEGTSA